MARPRGSDDSQNDLVAFDPIPEDDEAEEIYEVDTPASRSARGATPTPGVRQRLASPSPASSASPPSAVEMRASFSGRHREVDDDRRRGPSSSPLIFVAVGVLGLGCAGVLTATAFGLAMTGVAPTPEAPLAAPEAPQEFGGVPVERGFRRGDGGARGPAPRPDEPTP
jgi:hypothetical protein